VWVLEWHHDGFPHYHVLIEMADRGRASRIGQDWIHAHWFDGSRIHEQFFDSENHFKWFAGYFKKHGYFGDKEHQSVLPSWALNEKKTIRRFGRKNSNEKLIERGGVPRVGFVVKRGRVSYRDVLESCGACSEISVLVDGDEVFSMRVEVSYKNVRSAWHGEYEIGVGFVLDEPWSFVLGVLRSSGYGVENDIPF
jgi:hypothetical protein